MKRYLLLLITLTLSYSLNSQNFHRVSNIAFYHSKALLKSPLTGGTNAPLISQMDFNNDGKKDIFISNFNSNKISTYINKGDSGEVNYVYAPEYESYFPRGITTYVLLRDVDGDGLEDMITHITDNIPYYVWYKSKWNSGKLDFTYQGKFSANYYDTLISADTLTPIGHYIPIFRDLDNDGDMDMVIVERGALGQNHALYCKNVKIENGLSYNHFMKENLYWGQHTFGFYPLVFINDYYDSVKSLLKVPNKNLQPRHDDFQMMWELHADKDDVWDVVALSEAQSNAPLGLNIGTLDSAHFINEDTYFPSNDVQIPQLMPIGIYGDFNNDGLGDFVTSSMLERDNNATALDDKRYNDDIYTMSLYTNTGKQLSVRTNLINEFKLTDDRFLAGDNIDVGTNSSAVFYDYDNDTLDDILISNFIRRDSYEVANITYYQNIGTKKNPAYQLKDHDFLKYKSKGYANIRLAVGDIDADGKKDLMIAGYERRAYTSVATFNQEIDYRVIYKKGNLYISDTINKIDDFGRNGLANICLFNADKDSLVDLFIGDFTSIKYYKNVGTKLKPFFKLINNSVIDTGKLYKYKTDNFYFSPAVHTENGKDYLYFSYSPDYGKIGKALIDTAKLAQDTFIDIVNKDVIKASLNKRTAISFGNFDENGQVELLLGNYAGGIQIYSLFNYDSVYKEAVLPDTVKEVDLSVVENDNYVEFQIFPNPFTNHITIKKEDYKKYKYQIYNIDGRLLDNGELTKQVSAINTQEFANGIYYIRFLDDNSHVVKSVKIIKYHH